MNELVWMMSRSTGLGAMVLLSASGVLGMLAARTGGGSLRGGRSTTDGGTGMNGAARHGNHTAAGTGQGIREAVRVGVHRSLSLVSVVFLVVHILTAVLDKAYTNISPWTAVVPLVFGDNTVGIMLGTLSVDLLILVIVTSILRPSIPQAWWKPIHYTSYTCLVLALGHGLLLREPGDLITPAVVTVCAGALIIALLLRLTKHSPDDTLRTALGRTQWR